MESLHQTERLLGTLSYLSWLGIGLVAVREVAGSTLRPDEQSGSLNNLREIESADFVLTSANGYTF